MVRAAPPVTYVPTSTTACAATATTCPAVADTLAGTGYAGLLIVPGQATPSFVPTAATVTAGTSFSVQFPQDANNPLTYSETSSASSTDVVVTSSGAVRRPARRLRARMRSAGTSQTSSSSPSPRSFTLTVTGTSQGAGGALADVLYGRSERFGGLECRYLLGQWYDGVARLGFSLTVSSQVANQAGGVTVSASGARVPAEHTRRRNLLGFRHRFRCQRG